MSDVNYKTLLSAGLLISVGVLVLNDPRWSSAASSSKPVEVVNPTTSPVPTFDVDKPALQPVHHECVGTIPAGVAISGDVTPPILCLYTTVPSNKRLVVEFVSVSVVAPAGQTPSVQIGTATAGLPSGNAAIDHEIALLEVSAGTATASQPVKLYSDPGSSVEIIVARNDTVGSLVFDVTWSGHLVDFP